MEKVIALAIKLIETINEQVDAPNRVGVYPPRARRRVPTKRDVLARRYGKG